MKISYNWLKEYIDISLSPEQIDQILTGLGIEVEKIEDYSKKYHNFVIGRVLKSEFVEGSDHLHYCEVTDSRENYNVICGAPNVAEGQKVVLGLPGAILPINGLKLEKKKIRGLVSNGMICSKYELDIEDDHSGIWVLPDDAPIGEKFADWYGLNDVIFEISVTPNRGDCLSHIGIAREIAAYCKIPVNYPKLNLIENSENINDYTSVEIIDTKNNPRYCARVVKNVKVKESPDWLKRRLSSVGLRPINNIVDITNYILYELNQPLHAFDLDKLSGHKIIVKPVNEGEKFKTLDDKERILDNQMLMICDAEKSVAIAGVMGGKNSEITPDTKNVLIESAYFNPSSIRKTSKKLGLSSDSSYRFERGTDWKMAEFAANRAAQLIAELADGEIVQGLIDKFPNPIPITKIELRFDRVRKIIGIDLTNEYIVELLSRLNFEIENILDEKAMVCVPSWRSDISLEIDLIEEIARLYNYDNITPQFVSQIDTNAQPIPDHLAIPKLRGATKLFLTNRGFNEILTQNMIEPNIAKYFSEELITIANPLGEELSIMRPSIIPAMLKTLRNNERVGNDILKFYEIGKIFKLNNNPSNFIQGISEEENLIIAVCGYTNEKQWGIPQRKFDFYDIKGVVTEFFDYFKFKGIEFTRTNNEIKGFSPKVMQIIHNNSVIGAFGEINSDLLKYYDLSLSVYCALIDLSKLYKLESKDTKYEPLCPYPAVFRDLAFIVDENTQAGDVLNTIISNGTNLLKSCQLFDLYKGKSIGEGKKSVAFSLEFSSHSKTLTDEEIEPIISNIVKAVESQFSAILRKI